jgi:rhodanese-related sulfurtransferase
MRGKSVAKTVSVNDLNSVHTSPIQLIDVRSRTEYSAGHVPGTVNIPLEEIASRLEDIRECGQVVLVCKSGKRAQTAACLIGDSRDVSVLSGGTDAWRARDLPLVVNTRTRWSLERQVRLGAGLLVLLGVVLALTVNPLWLFLGGFVGAGLTFAGATDMCPMGIVLCRMPWNQVGRKSQRVNVECCR